jgi:hypothetical protein
MLFKRAWWWPGGGISYLLSPIHWILRIKYSGEDNLSVFHYISMCQSYPSIHKGNQIEAALTQQPLLALSKKGNV